MTDNVQGINDLNRTLSDFMNRAVNRLPAMKEIGIMLAGRIQGNFRTGGRPPWAPSRRAIKESGQTLLKTGRLMKSVSTPEITAEAITFGSNLPYAAIHQFGGTIEIPARSSLYRQNRVTRGPNKGRFRRGTTQGRGFTTKAYTIHMPARPYVVFGDQEFQDAGAIALSHLLGRS